MSVTGLTPYNLSDLLSGPCRWLMSEKPGDIIIPDSLLDIQEVERTALYAPAEGFVDLGATTDGGAYAQQISTAGFQIDQATGDVAQTVSDVVRSAQGTFAQVSPFLLRIMEQAAEIKEVAAKPGRSAEEHIAMGSIEALERYTIAIVGRRLKGQGHDVIEPDGTVRGALVAAVLYNTSITGDQRTIQLARGQLSSAQMTFQTYPADGQPSGEEYGDWIVEKSGTIVAAS